MKKKGLITSMNLHEHSQAYNWEMGIRFTKVDDPAIYGEAYNEVQMIVKQSKENPKIKREPVTLNPQSATLKSGSPKIVRKPKMTQNKGLLGNIVDSVTGEEAYCIRCDQPMDKFNTDRPLRNNCYPIWVQYKDPNYKERYCHSCGQEKNSISYAKPVCYDCYQHMNVKPRK